MPTLKELYDKYNFPYGKNPKEIDTNTPSTLEIDIEQNKHWLKETPNIYGTDSVRILSGGQVDKDKVRGIIGKIAGKSKLGGFIKKLIAPTSFKPSDLIENGETIDPLYLGIEQGGGFGGSIIKSVKQYLKDNKTQQNIVNGARGLAQDIAVDGLKMLGNAVLKKAGIAKTDNGLPTDVRKISSVSIGKKELIFPSTIVISQNKNVGGVISNQEQTYFVDGIELNNVFKKRITIGNDLKPLISDEEIGKEANKKIESLTYFQKPTSYTYNVDGAKELKDVGNYEELVKVFSDYKGSILLGLKKDFSHNIRNSYLAISSNPNDILVFSGNTITKKTQFPSYYPLIGTLDGKEPELNQLSSSVDIYGTNTSTNGDIDKKINRKFVQRWKDSEADTKSSFVVKDYDSKENAYINKVAPKGISKAPTNLTLSIGGIQFPSTITDFQDSLTPNWDSVNPIGAGVPFYVFNNVEREISFKLTLYAENEKELFDIRTKYNSVGKLAWSRRSGYGAYGNITTLKIGNLISEKGFISSWTLGIDTTIPWDIINELPMLVTIDVSFKVATNNDTESYDLYSNGRGSSAKTLPPGASAEKKKKSIG